MTEGKPRACVICGEEFAPVLPGNSRANVCSPECRAERKRRNNLQWYQMNRRSHIAGQIVRKQEARRKRK